MHTIRPGFATLTLGLSLAVLVDREPAAGGQPSVSCLPTYRATRDRVPSAVNTDFTAVHGTGDFNHDGLKDVAFGTLRFASAVKFPIHVLVNTGQGGFVDRTSEMIEGEIPTFFHPRRLAVADFNGDGRDDIFVATHGQDIPFHPGERNGLLLSQPNGRLRVTTDTLPDLNDFTHALAVGDIDQDGDLDLFIGNFSGQGDNYKLSYFLVNDGRGQFAMALDRVPTVENANSVLVGVPGAAALVDLSGDQKPDLVIGDHGGKASRVYLNDGRGFFVDASRITLPRPTVFGFDADVVDLIAEDFDGDKIPDLVFSLVRHSDYFGRRLQLLITRPEGRLTFDDQSDRLAVADFGPSQQAWYQFLQALDFNRDGRQDILVNALVTGGAQQPVDTPFVLINTPSGPFVPKTDRIFGTRLARLGPLQQVDLRANGNMDLLGLGFQFELYEQTGCEP